MATKIHQLFRQEGCPRGDALVKHDGWDEIDKEHAERNWLGTSWETLIAELDSGKRGNAGSLLEQWTLLESDGIRYYILPFLLHAIAVLKDKRPDEDFLHSLFFELSEILRRHGTALWNINQKNLLLEMCDLTEAAVVDDPKFDFFPDAIIEAVAEVRALLRNTEKRKRVT